MKQLLNKLKAALKLVFSKRQTVVNVCCDVKFKPGVTPDQVKGFLRERLTQTAESEVIPGAVNC